MEVVDRLQHHQDHLGCGGRLDLAGAGLDKISPCLHGNVAGEPDPIQGAQLSGLQNHLEVGAAARLLYLDDFIRHPTVIAPQKVAAGDHHINLIGPLAYGVASVFQFHLERIHAARKGRGHRGDLDRRSLERFPGNPDHGWINANRRH